MPRTTEWKHAVVFLSISALAAFSGALGPPDAWYAGLAKPAFMPPNWVFPSVWTLLYFVVAFAAARVFTYDGLGVAIWIWGAQMVLNALWTPIFFRYHLIGWALIDAIALFVLILATIVAFWRVDRVSARLMIPYALWVGFAVVLTGSLWQLNTLPRT